MRPEQLCFFRFSRPLLERFGADFFRDIPKTPGVYIFTGESDRVLYVGKSQNLRQRLAYYKNAQPEREPRRIIRLVHQTRRIEFECCESPEAARLRELALIGQHRPRFNVANTLSPTYTFFGLLGDVDRFSLRIALRPVRRDGETLVGAFRNRGLCARAFCAMAKRVAAEEMGIRTIFDFPAHLHDRTTQFEGLPGRWRDSIEGVLRGEDDSFLDGAASLAERQTDPFLKQLFEADFLAIAEFFELAREMREARAFHELPILSQEALQVSSFQMYLRKASGMATEDDHAIASVDRLSSQL